MLVESNCLIGLGIYTLYGFVLTIVMMVSLL